MVTAVGDDTRRGGWGLVIQIKQAVAEAHRDEIAFRTWRGLEGRARRGEPAGGNSYGCRPALTADGKRTRVIVPEEAEIIKEIFERRAAGQSAVTLCRALNARGIPAPGARWKRTHRGKYHKNPTGDWLPSCIGGEPQRPGIGILNNPIYIGRVIWGRSKWTRGASDSNKRTMTLVDKSEWIITEHPELRIIDDALWEQVQAIQLATDPRKEAKRRGWLSRNCGVRKPMCQGDDGPTGYIRFCAAHVVRISALMAHWTTPAQPTRRVQTEAVPTIYGSAAMLSTRECSHFSVNTL